VGEQRKRVKEGKKIKTNNYKVNYRQNYIETLSIRRVSKYSEMCEGELKRKKYIYEIF
jgi:hypothetical protein